MIRWACLAGTAALCLAIGWIAIGVWLDHALSITIGGTR